MLLIGARVCLPFGQRHGQRGRRVTRFSAQFLDEVRARLACSQVVGRKVRLKKAGREWKGLSPFTQEKTPSFFVNDAKGKWFDFSADKSGDIFTFIVETQGLSFPEAVELLAREAGVELPKADADTVKREARRLGLVEILGRAQQRFQQNLRESKEARAYLDGRKITAQSVERFGLGYATSNDARAWLGEGIDKQGLVDCGLAIVDEQRPVYSRFRDRITVPIHDAAGHLAGFGGRTLIGASAKYLNSSETDTFHKGEIVFNFHRVRQAAHEGARIAVMEGYMDVISADQAGICAVGTMGTSLTEHQIRGLWRLTDVPVMCFDGDAAGRRAAAKAIEATLPLLVPGRSIKIALLPAGKDPDDMVREGGAEALGRALAGAEGLADAFWRVTAQGHSLGSPDDLAAVEAALLAGYDRIPDQSLRKRYVRDAKERLWRATKHPPIVRSNGYSNHSTAPGAIKLRHGLGGEDTLSLREAVILAQLVKEPEAADPERITEANGVSEHVRTVLAEIFHLIGSVPAEELAEAINQGAVGRMVTEAKAICHRAGINSLDA